MATVYLAEDLKHHRKVAVKVLRPELAAALGAERFLREVEIAARLEHPHILTLIDSGEADGFLYYVMPYVEGESLGARLAREGGLPIADAVRILQEVVDALAYAHARGVVHRDIKPDNVLLSGRHALVTDFGIAKAVSEATGRQELTTAGVALGTPTYMAPEQASAGGHIDQRADIYAVGVLAYELLAGRPPFTGATAQAVLAAHLTDAPDQLTRHRQSVPPALAQLVMKCLEKNPADRWQTGDELLPQLEAIATPSGGVAVGETGTRRALAAGGRLSRLWRPALGVAVVTLLVVAVWMLRGPLMGDRAIGGIPDDRKSIAVLPFTNTSGDPENEAFTDGIHDDILSRLSKIRELKVISRTSVMEYKDTRKNIREIGRELEVATILEGGVQRAGDRVRINAQLIDARTDEHLWSEVYNRELTIENIFAIQGEIAEQIAAALEATLSPAEKEELGTRPTENLEAYDYYARGNEYYSRGYAEQDLRIAVQMYEQAVEADPGFALAYARLSLAHQYLWWFFYDRSDERIANAKEAADYAVGLAPDLPEARAALGRYYYRRLDYDRALRELTAALKRRPQDSEILAALGYVQRRQGRMIEAAGNLERASELDPRSAILASETGDTYARLRNTVDAARYYDRAIALSPDFSDPYYGRARRLQLRLEGNPDAARATLAAAERAGARDFNFPYILVYIEVLEGNYQRALDQLASAPQAFETQHLYGPKPQFFAQIYGLMGNHELERAYYDSARVVLERELQARPDDSRLHSSLGIAYAGLGRKRDAIREGELAVSLLPVSREAMRGFYRVEDLARIYTMVGERDRAIEQLEYLLSIPGDLSAAILRIDAAWEPLRGHPRFRRLVSGDS